MQLTVSSVSLSDASDPAFTIQGDVPTSVAPGVSSAPLVEVLFQPSVEGLVTAGVIVESDGGNLDDNRDGVTSRVLKKGRGALDDDFGFVVESCAKGPCCPIYGACAEKTRNSRQCCA